MAPTPSGYLHLGNVLSFLLTEALARKYSAAVILRIDDMDRERTEKTYLNDIFDTLHFLGIDWQEGPADLPDFERHFSQVHRVAIYDKYLGQLRDEGALFACTCSRAHVAAKTTDGGYPGTCLHKNIPLDQPGVSWRLNTSLAGEIVMNTHNSGSNIMPFPASMRHFIVRKKDGFPAYQLTSVADDVSMGVDLVVRGDDLLPSSLAQVYLAGLLGEHAFGGATFLHHPLLTDVQGHKLSKSDGATSIYHLRLQGYSDRDVFHTLAGILSPGTGAQNKEELLPLLAQFAGVVL